MIWARPSSVVWKKAELEHIDGLAGYNRSTPRYTGGPTHHKFSYQLGGSTKNVFGRSYRAGPEPGASADPGRAKPSCIGLSAMI